MIRNTIEAVAAAMEEMRDSGIPIERFEPCNADGEYDFVFSAGLTTEQQQRAKEIVSKYIDGNWSYD